MQGNGEAILAGPHGFGRSLQRLGLVEAALVSQETTVCQIVLSRARLKARRPANSCPGPNQGVPCNSLI